MSRVIVISEWLPKENKDLELWNIAKEIMETTKKEKGCVRAYALRQISHPGSPGKSKYTIVLNQEYANVEAFDFHIQTDYVKNFFETCVSNPGTAIVQEWTCRLFSET